MVEIYRVCDYVDGLNKSKNVSQHTDLDVFQYMEGSLRILETMISKGSGSDLSQVFFNVFRYVQYLVQVSVLAQQYDWYTVLSYDEAYRNLEAKGLLAWGQKSVQLENKYLTKNIFNLFNDASEQGPSEIPGKPQENQQVVAEKTEKSIESDVIEIPLDTTSESKKIDSRGDGRIAGHQTNVDVRPVTVVQVCKGPSKQVGRNLLSKVPDKRFRVVKNRGVDTIVYKSLPHEDESLRPKVQGAGALVSILKPIKNVAQASATTSYSSEIQTREQSNTSFSEAQVQDEASGSPVFEIKPENDDESCSLDVLAANTDTCTYSLQMEVTDSSTGHILPLDAIKAEDTDSAEEILDLAIDEIKTEEIEEEDIGDDDVDYEPQVKKPRGRPRKVTKIVSNKDDNDVDYEPKGAKKTRATPQKVVKSVVDRQNVAEDDELCSCTEPVKKSECPVCSTAATVSKSVHVHHRENIVKERSAKMRRYREQVKKDPERRQKLLLKDRLRKQREWKKQRETILLLNDQQLTELMKEKGRLHKKIYRERKKNGEPSSQSLQARERNKAEIKQCMERIEKNVTLSTSSCESFTYRQPQRETERRNQRVIVKREKNPCRWS